MRIASGVTDQVAHFVAVDATDFTTRETGLSSFTVYRSRNGGTATAMTTPTVTELDATNMPGVYTLLLDEDMAVTTGNLTEAMAFHITHAGMAPVTLEVELFAPANYGLASQASVDTIDGIVDSILVDTAEIGAAGAGLTAVPWNASWDTEVQSEVTDALNAYDPPTNAEMEARTLASASYATAAALATVDGNVDAILVDTGTTLPASLATIDGNVDAILVDTGTTLPATLATIAGYLDTEIAAILEDTGTTIPATLADLATAANLATVDTVVDAIKAKTDSLTFTNTGVVDANITHVISDPVQAASSKETSWGGTE